jgi:hypothetical protein
LRLFRTVAAGIPEGEIWFIVWKALSAETQDILKCGVNNDITMEEHSLQKFCKRERGF